MNHVLVKDLLERLSHANPNAHVVLKTRNRNYSSAECHEFKVSIIAPGSEVVIDGEETNR